MTVKLPALYAQLSSGQRRQVRIAYAQQQKGLCLHCKAPLRDKPPAHIMGTPVTLGLFPPGFLSNPQHLHHDHTTGLTLGTVHARCNAILWQYHRQ